MVTHEVATKVWQAADSILKENQASLLHLNCSNKTPKVSHTSKRSLGAINMLEEWRIRGNVV